MEEKMQEDVAYFYNNSALLDMFRQLTAPEDDEVPVFEDDNAPESLD